MNAVNLCSRQFMVCLMAAGLQTALYLLVFACPVSDLNTRRLRVLPVHTEWAVVLRYCWFNFISNKRQRNLSYFLENFTEKIREPISVKITLVNLSDILYFAYIYSRPDEQLRSMR